MSVVKAVIDYRGNGEATQARASLWYASLQSEQGEQIEGLAADDLGVLLAALKHEHPSIKPTYTLRGWNRNVDEFEATRHYRR